jgi:uncharacterized protein
MTYSEKRKMARTFTSNDLLIFFLITFGISWGLPGLLLVIAQFNPSLTFSLDLYSPLYYLVVWSPALSALIMIAKTQGREAIIIFVRRLLHWRVGFIWYALALILIPVLYFLGSLLTWAIVEENVFGLYEGTLIQFLGIGILLRGTAGPVEELGWRGFALPLLQRKYTGLTAAIILGLVWGVWHMPSFVIGTLYQSTVGLSLVFSMPIFLVQIMAMSIILTLLYNGTGGSLLLVFLFHWMGNIEYPWEGGAEILPAQALMLSIVATILVIIFRRRFLAKENLYKDVAASSIPREPTR